MPLTKYQLAYVQLTAAIEKLHETHFPKCDDVSAVVEDGDDEEIARAVTEGEALLDTLFNK